jgi:hypothetical protein
MFDAQHKSDRSAGLSISLDGRESRNLCGLSRVSIAYLRIDEAIFDHTPSQKLHSI